MNTRPPKMTSSLTGFARLALALLATLTLIGCAATGPRYAEVVRNMPTLAAGKGRLVVYRPSSFGGAVQPDVKLNGEVIGKSEPRGFFFVDRPAGRHVVSARTEVEATLDVDLRDGAVAYVESSITLGVFVGQPRLSLKEEAVAMVTLPELAYIGSIPLVPGPRTAGIASGGPGAAAPPPASFAPATARPTGSNPPVTLDDLRGLMPAAR